MSAAKEGTKEKTYQIGTIVFIPTGLDDDGELVNTKTPGAKVLEDLRQHRLVVDKSPTGRILEFCVTWSQVQIDEWLHGLFPDAFAWLDKFFPLEKGNYHWKLAASRYTKLFVIQREETTGNDLYTARGSASRAYRDYTLRFVCTREIRPDVYRNWEKAMTVSEALENDNSEMEVEPLVKKRAPRRNVVKDSNEDPENEDVESEVDSRPIIRVTARRRQKDVKTEASPSILTVDDNDEAVRHPDMAIPILSDSDDDELPSTTLLSRGTHPLTGHLDKPKQKQPLSVFSRAGNSFSFGMRRDPETSHNRGQNEDKPSRGRNKHPRSPESQEVENGDTAGGLEGRETKRKKVWFSQYNWGTPPPKPSSPSAGYDPRESTHRFASPSPTKAQEPVSIPSGSRSLGFATPPDIDYDVWI
ncbi:hypothetical protein EST38_g8454 [Candolleomyces aberdarensis]|uniref:Uncharacterized protein n=1 Tax=Candolleomyces aberdarensis TaxID=2316362 RepID=A0A4Q2DEK7_9AGAR|nr:hypothetical protein EST38_g8454 [Candolleomyces aberdarensis]